MRPVYTDGRYFVRASRVSYMWLSASNTGKSRARDGMDRPFCQRGRDTESGQMVCWPSDMNENVGCWNGTDECRRPSAARRRVGRTVYRPGRAGAPGGSAMSDYKFVTYEKLDN